MGRRWQWALGLAISAASAWVALRGVAAAEVAASLAQVSAAPLCGYAVALAGVQICRGARWQRLVRPFAPIGAWTAFRHANVGTLAVTLMPFRLGELARPALLRAERGASFAAGLAAVTVERVLDGLVVTLAFFVASERVRWPAGEPAALAWGARLSLLVFVAAAAALAGGFLARGAVERAAARLAARGLPVGRAVGLWRAFMDGAAILPDGAATLAVVGWTAAYWGVNALGLSLLAQAFGWAWPPVNAWLAVSTLCIGIMLPAGPGFLGTYQAALVLALSALGVEAGDAAAYALVAYVVNLAVVLAFGLPHMLLERDRAWMAQLARRGA